MNRIESIVNEILKESADISQIDPKIQNRIKAVKKVYQQIDTVQKQINEAVGDLQNQIKDLEKQAGIFMKEIIPVLKDLEDHAIAAEGIFIELKKGRRSPKVGYEYLAERVSSELLLAAEEAMTKVAEFAKSPTVTVSNSNQMTKNAGLFDWLKRKWNDLLNWLKGLKRKNTEIGKALSELDKITK